jgi:hypothetical protein
MACLKVDMQGFDEQAAERMVTPAANSPLSRD